MEIRARIDLAVQQFRTNAASVGTVFRSMTMDAQKHAQATDKLIQKNLVNRLDASQKGKVADMKNLTDFEKQMIASNRRMQKAAMESQYRNRGGVKSTMSGMQLPVRDVTAQNNIKHRRTLESQYNAWWQGQLQKNLGLRVRYEVQGVKASVQAAAQRTKATALEMAEAAKVAAYKAKYNAVYYIGKAKMVGQSMATTIKETAFEIREKAKATFAIMSLKAKEVAFKMKQHKANLDWQRAEDDKYFNWLEKRSKNNLKNRSSQNQFQAKLEFVGSKEFEQMAPRIRYALYDIATRAAAVSTAMTAMGVAAIKIFTQFESAFTSVERTAGLARDSQGRLTDESKKLKNALLDISATIPVAFEDVAQIATLGAQMGIAAEALDDFSLTVAKFSAITGISAEQTATSFGRLSQLMDVPVTKFENLSSAIAFTGVNSVATDQEILTMSESIAAAGTQAGLSADQIIGLSATLASLKVRPEEARGVIVRLFREIDLSVSQGGKQLEDFSRVLGVSSEEAANLWKQNPNEFFTSFLEGAKAAGTLNETITALGITNSRELNVIQRVANNLDLLGSTLGDAREEYLLGQYATEAYGMVADDLQSKLTVLNNTFQQVVASFAEPIGEFLKGPIDFITDLLKNMRNVPPLFSGFITVLGIAIAAVLSLAAGSAFLMAGMLALRTVLVDVAVGQTNVTVGAGLMRAMFTDLAVRTGVLAKVQSASLATSMALAGGFTRLGMTAGFASKAAIGLTRALPVIGLALTAVGIAMAFTSENSQDTAESFAELGDKAVDANGGLTVLASALVKDTEAFNKAEKAAAGTGVKYGELKIKLSELAIEQGNVRKTQIASKELQEDLSNSLRGNIDANDDNAVALGSAADQQERFNKVTAEGNGLKEEQTYILGGNSAALYLEGFSKYIDSEGNVRDLFLDFAADPDIYGDAAAFGYNIQDSINAGLADAGTGGTKYLAPIEERFNKFRNALQKSIPGAEATGKNSIDLIKQAGEEAKLSADGVSYLVSQYGQLTVSQLELQLQGEKGGVFGLGAAAAGSLSELSPAIKQATESTDAYWQSAIQAMGADKARADLINQMTIAYGDDEQILEALSAQMKQYLDAATGVEDANNSAYDSFSNFATGTKEAGNSLTGVTKGARTNMKNWQSYISSALAASEADMSGLHGFVGRAFAAMKVMATNGIDTSEQFIDTKEVIINSLGVMGEGFDGIAAQLSAAPNMEAFKAVISDAMNNATVKSGKVYDQLVALYAAIEDPTQLENFASIWAESMLNTEESTGSAGAAVDKLQEALDRAFKSMLRFISLNESVKALGQSLVANGASFNKFSEGGQNNINALIATIQTLKDQSGDSPKVLADNLASLRQALINTGTAGPQALKLIKKAMNELGVSGKKSTAVVKQFAAQIRAMNSETNQVIALANAMGELTSSVMEYLNAKWMLGNTQMEISAGWESIAAETNKAKDAISDISDEIAGMTATKGILEYQLSIALKYGDTLRANEIRAELDALASQKAELETSNKAEVAAAASSATPKADLLAQAQALQNIIGLYVAEGAAALIGVKNKKEAKEIINETVQKFKDQAAASGISEENVKKYAKELRTGLKLAAELNQPVKYKVNAATKDALAEIRSFAAKSTTAINNIPKVVEIKVVATPIGNSSPAAFIAQNLKGKASGGYISGPGSATSDSIPTMLSNGEYVIRAAAVSSYGVDFMNSLNNMTLRPSASRAVAAPTAQGSGVVYLSPEDRSLLRAAIDRPINLYTDNAKIAQSANSGNVLLAQRGIN